MRKPGGLLIFSCILIFIIPIQGMSQLNALSARKFAPSLDRAFRSKAEKDSIEIVVSFSSPEVLELFNKKVHIINNDDHFKTAVLKMLVADVRELSVNKGVLFLNTRNEPKEELTTGFLDKSTNKINLLQAEFPSVDGHSITTSIKEQKLDTSDIDFKGRYISSGLEASNSTNHASLMATIAAGGGNSTPAAKGVASGTAVTSVNFLNLLPEPDSFFKQKKVSIQNHSYGTIVENFYGPEAMSYDISANDNPSLLHVFSAGNSGLTTPADGIYKDIPSVANLTGNFKMAKNIITVASTDSFYHIETLSSKGPAYDGRVKPELVAFGQDGSSGAAALVSGTVAVLQQAYKSSHQDSLPSSELIKAILLNAADDVGPKGIDFKSGYGSLNGYQSLKTIYDQRYFQSSLANKQTRSFSINVPPGAGSIKLTLAWNDVAANINASKALVNDLDAILKFPATGETWLPWVLNSSPNIDSLNQLPVRQKDTLNNVEQISLDNPSPGLYTIEIRGSIISTPSQGFALAYQFDTTKLKWSFPTHADNVLAGADNVLRWSTKKSSGGSVDFSFNGKDWFVADTIPDLSLGYLHWQAPDTLTTALLRLETTSGAVYVSDTFLISKPLQMKVGFNCTDSFLFYWNKEPTNNYQIFALGDKYFQPLLDVADTFVILDKNKYPYQYFSVAPLYKNKAGLKSAALNYSAQGTECYFQSFYLQNQTETTASFFASFGSLYGIKSISLQKSNPGPFSTITTINNPGAINFLFHDSLLNRGVSLYRLQITLTKGQVLYSNVIPVYGFKDEQIIVYPNPSRQNSPINIITNQAGRIEVKLYNGNGMLVRQMRLDNVLNHVETFSLSKGIYFLEATTDEGNISIKKIVVL
jgi:hypothetical protein